VAGDNVSEGGHFAFPFFKDAFLDVFSKRPLHTLNKSYCITSLHVGR